MKRMFGLALLAIGWGAQAHDLGCNGVPVAPTTKTGCCGEADALQVPARSVIQDQMGVWHVILDGSDHALIDTTGAPLGMLPSNDGCYWVWYRRQHLGAAPPYPPSDPHGGDGPNYHFYCFQGPFPT